MVHGRFVLEPKEEQRSSASSVISANQSLSLTELEAVCCVLLKGDFFNVAVSSFGPFISLISSKIFFHGCFPESMG